jgi:hypothetical protein
MRTMALLLVLLSGCSGAAPTSVVEGSEHHDSTDDKDAGVDAVEACIGVGCACSSDEDCAADSGPAQSCSGTGQCCLASGAQASTATECCSGKTTRLDPNLSLSTVCQ